MTILQAIRAAIEAGRLKEPFTARDVVGALQEHRFSYGSLMSSSAVIAARGRMHPYAGSGAAAIG